LAVILNKPTSRSRVISFIAFRINDVNSLPNPLGEIEGFFIDL